MKDIARMLRRHQELILNWFRAKKQFNNGMVEGLNLKWNLTEKSIRIPHLQGTPNRFIPSA